MDAQDAQEVEVTVVEDGPGPAEEAGPEGEGAAERAKSMGLKPAFLIPFVLRELIKQGSKLRQSTNVDDKPVWVDLATSVRQQLYIHRPILTNAHILQVEWEKVIFVFYM